MGRRIWNFIAGGLLMGWAALMALGALTAGTLPGIWFLVAWVALGFLTARSGLPWPNTWAVLAVLTFILPVALFLGFGVSGVDAAQSDAEAVGAALGSLIGSGIVGIFSFFLGVVFALLAIFTRQSANTQALLNQRTNTG